jgi:hypothetical protein
MSVEILRLIFQLLIVLFNGISSTGDEMLFKHRSSSHAGEIVSEG